jgi:predicted HAD superfamily Cof-like phosphohydrolase
MMNQLPTNSMYEDISVFHRLVLQDRQPELPGLINQEWCLERFRFLNEEADEFYKAAMSADMVGAVDGLLDDIYVALGTLWQMGLSNDTLQECWRAVQNANMRKVRGIGPRGMKVDAIKPKGWYGPEQDIAKAIGKSLD